MLEDDVFYLVSPPFGKQERRNITGTRSSLIGDTNMPRARTIKAPEGSSVEDSRM